jgi:hypothetical protein
MKMWESVTLERPLSNVTAAIMIRFPCFLISKSILQRYDFFPFMWNTRILLLIDEIPYSFFFNNFVVITFLDKSGLSGFLFLAGGISMIFLFRFPVVF